MEAAETGAVRTLLRAGIIALVLFGVVVGGIAAVAWLSADEETLPLEYDGFD